MKKLLRTVLVLLALTGVAYAVWRVRIEGAGVSELDQATLELAAADPGSVSVVLNEADSEDSLDIKALSKLRTRAELEAVRAKLVELVPVELLAADASEPDSEGLEVDGQVELEVDAGVLVLLSEVEKRLGDVDRALVLAELACERAPHKSESHHAVSKALVAKMKTGGMIFAMSNLGKLKTSLRQAVELDGNNLQARWEEAAMYLIAPAFAGGDRERGLALIEELKPLAPQRAAGLLVMLHAMQEEDELAEEILSAALKEHPDDRELLMAQARSLEDEEEPAAGLAAYEALTTEESERDPVYYQALYAQARLRIESNQQPQLALEALDEYIRDGFVGLDFTQSNAAAHWRRGKAHLMLDDSDSARASFEASLELDPEFEQAQDSLKELNETVSS